MQSSHAHSHVQSYETTESTLRKECETYGTVKELKIVYDREGKPTGFAFAEYELERDMLGSCFYR